MLLFLLFLSFDELLGVVGTSGITKQEVMHLSRLYPGVRQEELLDKMIMGRVIVSVAREETVVVSEEEVNDAKSRLLEQMPGLQSMLSHSYIDSLYNEELRIQIYTRKLIQSKFQGRINVPPARVRVFYETHKDSFALPQTVAIERLDVPVVPEEENELHLLAERIISLYHSGTDFAVLVNKYSNDTGTKYVGGELGTFRAEDLPPYLSGVMELPPGEVGLFESPKGYHIVQLKKSDINGVELAHIFLQFDFSEKELSAAEKRAGEIRERWERGDSTLNRQIISMGAIPIKALGYSLSALVDTLDEGEICSPVLQGSNFYLLRVVEKREGGIPAFSEVKTNIHNMLYQRMVDKALKEWFEGIKEEVFIKKL